MMSKLTEKAISFFSLRTLDFTSQKVPGLVNLYLTSNHNECFELIHPILVLLSRKLIGDHEG